MLNLKIVDNRELYGSTDSVESMVVDPDNHYARRREEACMNEIVRRMQEASRRPLVRQEA